jgi:hypothetical protein
MRRLTKLPVLATALAAIALTGCGETKIDQGKTEDLAKQVANSGSVKLKSVSCPSDLKAQKGKDFDCDLVYQDGAKGTITIHQKDDSGNITTSAGDIHIAGQ